MTLVGYYRKIMTDSTIPKMWQEYIRNSTEATDTVILLSQFNKWGIREEIDPSLRGEELYEAVLDSKMLRILELADAKAKSMKKAWPEAFAIIMAEEGITPSPGRVKAIRDGSVSIEGDMYVEETGTARYVIKRHYSQVKIFAPAEWIMENCGPEYDDESVARNFINGLSRGFVPKDVKGFEYRAAVEPQVRMSSRDIPWDPKGMCGQISHVLPISTQVKSIGEFVSTVTIHEGVSDPIKTDADVDARRLHFTGMKHSRGRNLMGPVTFPVTPGMSSSPIVHEDLAFEDAFNPDIEEETQLEIRNHLTNTLRRIYKEIFEIREYESMMAEAKGKK
jgi:hypothetical protein